MPAPGSQWNQRTCWDPRPWAPEPKGSVVRAAVGLVCGALRGAERQRSGGLSPDLATPSPATGALGLWFSSQAFALPKRRSLNSRSLLFLELQLLQAKQEMRLKGSGSPAPLPCPPADLVTWVCLRWELGLPCTEWAAASQAGCASVAFWSWPCCPKLLWLKATA